MVGIRDEQFLLPIPAVLIVRDMKQLLQLAPSLESIIITPMIKSVIRYILLMIMRGEYVIAWRMITCNSLRDEQQLLPGTHNLLSIWYQFLHLDILPHSCWRPL